MLAIGALVAVTAVVATVLVVSAPRPVAALQQTGTEPDEQVLTLVQTLPQLEIDSSTLSAHGEFRGWEVWSGVNAYDSACLVVLERSTDAIRARCAPHPAEVVVDSFPYELADGGMGRFILRGESVDAFVLFPQRSDDE